MKRRIIAMALSAALGWVAGCAGKPCANLPPDESKVAQKKTTDSTEDPPTPLTAVPAPIRPATRPVKFENIASYSPKVVTGTVAHTPDHAAASITFDAFKIDMQTADSPLFQSAIATLGSAITAAPNSRGDLLMADVRGFIDKDADSRVLLLIDLGSNVRTFEYPFGRAIKAVSLREVIYRSTKSEMDKSAPPLALSVLVVVERRTAANHVVVQIDSVDVAGTSK